MHFPRVKIFCLRASYFGKELDTGAVRFFAVIEDRAIQPLIKLKRLVRDLQRKYLSTIFWEELDTIQYSSLMVLNTVNATTVMYVLMKYLSIMSFLYECLTVKAINITLIYKFLMVLDRLNHSFSKRS